MPIKSPSSRLHAADKRRQQGGGKSTEYIDDCFGLISLSSLVVAHDAVFCATFIVLSTVALVATRTGRIRLPEDVSAERQRRAVPAVVAIAALLLSPAAETLAAPLYTQDLDDNARFLELAVCAVSVAYGFFSKVDDQEER